MTLFGSLPSHQMLVESILGFSSKTEPSLTA